MADHNGAEASAPASAQDDNNYVFQSFQEYRWDLDKDFLVSKPTHAAPASTALRGTTTRI